MGKDYVYIVTKSGSKALRRERKPSPTVVSNAKITIRNNVSTLILIHTVGRI